ncbi:MAG: 4-hydroxy-2-oxo-heptane-1,7-dioate aldolase [Paracoccaceae bacterium]|nr:4-hydroxy-2-oxo-heptane-1,7-dioate aldolase [Paracoccaceae bacterium]MDE3121451.1 4-hydroxy-2-oxo-heptane-1,7-dioate aldolase [Paracoccaceae bacterium]MDE3238559.1 4-hydroxy-2-oxo-heptane-1,7-dioate aldolase [Paracoccaceae bacterium]
MKPIKNTFKQAIAEGRQQIGLWVTLPSTFTAEALATCGYDWLLFDTEHAIGDPISVFEQLQAAAPYPSHSVVRPSANDPTLIKRILDAGAQSIIVPYVQTVEEAQAAVAAVRYAPQGMRGVAGITRATRYGTIEGYTEAANDDICLIVQCETAATLDRIEAIAAVDGVDGIFIGPADLAATMGHPGNPGHPDVVIAIEDAIRRIRKAGKPAGILTLDPDFVRRCMQIGTVFTAVDVDAAILLRHARRIAEQFKALA